MKKQIFIVFNLIMVCLCGCNNKDVVSEKINAYSNEHIIVMDINDEKQGRDLTNDFINGDIPAYYDDDTVLWFKDLSFNEESWDSFSLGLRADVDNDGENEQILEGPYGGMCLDVREERVWVLAHGQGTATVVECVLVGDIYWIVYKDTGHPRAYFHFIRYCGGENPEEEHILQWREEENDERHYYYDEEEITEEEYEDIILKYYGEMSGNRLISEEES